MTRPSEPADLLDEILFAHARERALVALASSTRFAYYTTAETAYRILESGEIWLRNAKLMNDFSEVEYGMRCLSAAFSSPLRERLGAVLDACCPGAMPEVGALFAERLPNFELDTFLTCVSEHMSSEDRRGRLSTWRAYGGSTGVALVVNLSAALGNARFASVALSPVLYADAESFATHFEQIVAGMERNVARLKECPPVVVKEALFSMLMFAVLCTKHPGFAEESEWRAIASPSLTGIKGLKQSTEIVAGIPQRVLKLPLADSPENGFVGLNIPTLIDRVIIGPCAHPQVTFLAFAELLAARGVSEPNKRICVTDIPLRHDA